MRIDLHSHTFFSDGELVPSELIRRALVLGHDAIAITDHVDITNIEFVVPNIVKAAEMSDENITVVPGVELTYVPPSRIDEFARKAKSLGAEIVVVHGETPVEPVPPLTNLEAVKSSYVDILAHPGIMSSEEANIAAKNDVALEISGRAGHSLANGHVVKTARAAGAKMVVNSDAHSPYDLMEIERAMLVALGAGMTEEEAAKALNDTPYNMIKHLFK